MQTKKLDPLVEAVKEGLRVAVLGALGVVVESLVANTFSWKVTAVAAGVAALKAVDKWIHTNPNIELKGLLPW